MLTRGRDSHLIGLDVRETKEKGNSGNEYIATLEGFGYEGK